MPEKNDPVSEYLAGIGRKGGQARVPKGTSVLTDEQRREQGRKAAEARWGVKKKATAKKAPKKRK